MTRCGAARKESWNFHDPDAQVNQREDEGRGQKSVGRQALGSYVMSRKKASSESKSKPIHAGVNRQVYRRISNSWWSGMEEVRKLVETKRINRRQWNKINKEDQARKEIVPLLRLLIFFCQFWAWVQFSVLTDSLYKGSEVWCPKMGIPTLLSFHCNQHWELECPVNYLFLRAIESIAGGQSSIMEAPSLPAQLQHKKSSFVHSKTRINGVF